MNKKVYKYRMMKLAFIDIKALINIIFLMFLGLLLITSAGSGIAEKLGLSYYYFVKKQSMFTLIGIFIMIIMSILDEQNIRKIIIIGFVITVTLLILVIFYGDVTKGAKRWINIYGLTIQPSEFLKPFYTCFIALILAYKKVRINFTILCTCITINNIIVILLLLEPDFGMTVTNIIVTFALVFIAGIKISWLLFIFISFLIFLYSAYSIFPHVAIRINKFFDPTSSLNCQVQQSISSYLKGGFFGKGPGEGTIKYILPDAHTDFIFAVGAEEFGFIFCMIVIIAFSFFILRGLWRLTEISNLFHIYAVFGIMMHFFLQFFFNIGVTLNILPTKGTTLPFISYGGSSILAFSIAAGIYLNLSKSRQENHLLQKQQFFFVGDDYNNKRTNDYLSISSQNMYNRQK